MVSIIIGQQYRGGGDRGQHYSQELNFIAGLTSNSKIALYSHDHFKGPAMRPAPPVQAPCTLHRLL